MGEIFKLFGTIGINNKEANDGIDETTGKAKKSGSKIAGFFKKAAIAIGAAFVAKKLIDFSKLTVQAAATAKAMNAQFEQVFAKLQPEAQKQINAMAKEFGMVPNRLKPSMSKMTSMFKGLGLDTEAAMEQATKAVTLSADAAAFYDVAYEQANASLTSFVKGNYEAGESIGIFANDTQMAQFAIKQGVVASTGEWQKLDEATKQATRLEYAQNMQEMAGATGQAARESDSYENQMGNLKQAWQDFLAIVGGPILAPVVAGIKGLSSVIQIAGDKVQDLQVWFGGLIEQIKQTEAFAMLKDAVSSIIDKLNGFKSSFDTIKSEVMNNEIWNVFKGYLLALVEYWTGLFNGEGNLGQTFVRIFNMIREIALPILIDAINFAKDIISQLTTFWNQNGDQIIQAVKNAFQLIADIINFFMPVIQAVISMAWGNIKGVIQGALDIILGLIKIFTEIFTGDWSKLWEGIKQTLSGALKFAWNLINLILLKNMLGSIKSFATKGISSIKGFFTKIVSGAKSGMSSFSSTWKNGINLVKSIISGFKSRAVSIFNSLRSSVTSIFNGIKSAIQNPIQTAVNFVRKMIDKMKGFFDFSWGLPKLKLPKISIKGKFSLTPPKVPKFGIDWFADGGIMTKAMAFGMNGNDIMVGGEVPGEKEAILPLNRETLGGIGAGIASSMGWSNESITDKLDSIIDLLINFFNRYNMDMKVVMDTGALVGEIKQEINRQLGNDVELKGRGR